MLRRAAVVCVFLLACARQTSGGAVEVVSETVQDDKAEIVLDLSYAAPAAREVELTLKLRVNGLEESNKLVVETYIRGFNVESGDTRWDGFVPPRTPQTVRLRLSIPDGNDEATATVNVNRSHDSMSLLRRELTFVVANDGNVRLQP